MTIEQIEAADIVGNAFSDQRLMESIGEFVVDTDRLMDEKIRALYVIDKVMGTEADSIYPIVEQDVLDFIEAANTY